MNQLISEDICNFIFVQMFQYACIDIYVYVQSTIILNLKILQT